MIFLPFFNLYLNFGYKNMVILDLNIEINIFAYLIKFFKRIPFFYFFLKGIFFKEYFKKGTNSE